MARAKKVLPSKLTNRDIEIHLEIAKRLRQVGRSNLFKQAAEAAKGKRGDPMLVAENAVGSVL